MDARTDTTTSRGLAWAQDADGQPGEVLAAAARGQIDAKNCLQRSRPAKSSPGLLGGTRKSPDAQGEAYALLLAEYCRHSAQGNALQCSALRGQPTQALIRAISLQMIRCSTGPWPSHQGRVCRDVEVIGWLYQFYISERKDEVFAGFKKNKKAGAAEIPAATQLFTPHWIVRYLVENSLGRLWMLNRPSSRLVDQMEYYIAPVDGSDFSIKIKQSRGSRSWRPGLRLEARMLTLSAFDLLYTAI